MHRHQRWMMLAGVGMLYLASPALGQENQKSLDKCQKLVTAQGSALVKNTAKAVSNCLKKSAADQIKLGVDGAVSIGTRNACATQLQKIGRTDGKNLTDKFLTNIAKKCDPNVTAHSLGDLLGTGASVPESLGAENLGDLCHHFIGGDDMVDSYSEWANCIAQAQQCQALESVTTQYPRSLEWLTDVQGALDAECGGNCASNVKLTNGLLGMTTVLSSLDSDGDGALDISCGAGGSSQVLQSGQTASQQSGDDGDLQQGAAFSYTIERDSADDPIGTVLDNTTGLEWAKVDDSGGLHDIDNTYTWEDAFKTYLYGLNNTCQFDEGTDCPGIFGDAVCVLSGAGRCGFAGHRDWRIPDRRELLSLIDFGADAPAIQLDAFHVNCTPGCDITAECSCTSSSTYWTSTSLATGTTSAWVVDFTDGKTDTESKATIHRARAVRGPDL